jgi:hypothetical protein
VVGAPIEAGSSNERVHAVLVVDEGSMWTLSCDRPTPCWTSTRDSPSHRLAPARAAAHGRDAQAEARGDPRVDPLRRRASAFAAAGSDVLAALVARHAGAAICRQRRRSKSWASVHWIVWS